MTENEIRTLILRSQEEGYRELVRQYQKYVIDIIWRRIRTIGSIEDAKECMSDVFAHIFLHFDEINEGTLKGYIATVSERMAVDRFRKLNSGKATVPIDDEISNMVSDDIDIAEDAEISERNKLLFDKICSLGEPDATILIQKYYYERNSNDIAKRVGLSPVAVRKRISRALEKLGKMLSDEEMR